MFNPVIRTSLWICLLLTAAGANMHPYYIDVTEIRIDSHKHTLQLSCKLFTDDVQEALHGISGKPVDLQKKDAETNRILQAYVSDHLKIAAGKSELPLHFVGYETEDEACWCYLEANPRKACSKITITNTLLHQLHETQTHFIHCFYNGVRKSSKLVNPESNATFDFTRTTP